MPSLERWILFCYMTLAFCAGLYLGLGPGHEILISLGALPGAITFLVLKYQQIQREMEPHMLALQIAKEEHDRLKDHS